MEYSSELHDPQVIVPLSDWRGTYDRGTTIVGNCLLYTSNGKQLAPPPDSTPSNPDQYGGVAGGGTYGGTKEHCIDVDWPAAYTWGARQYRRGYSGPDAWMGSLIFESRDASGLYYRRNRYYDSETGRFTQEDPIGLAGGINLYGFAAGDPVTYDDVNGLRLCFRGANVSRLIQAAMDASNTTFAVDAENCVIPGSVQPRNNNPGWVELQKSLRTLVENTETLYTVGWVDALHPCPSLGSCTVGNDARISLFDLRVTYRTCDDRRYPQGFPTTLPKTIVHEVLGHLTDNWLAVHLYLEGHALQQENRYHRAITPREPERCRGGYVNKPYAH